MTSNEDLNKQRKQQIGCDLIIFLGSQTFLAHRDVLINRLRFFRTRISTNEKESVLTLEPKNVDPEVFGDVLQCIYISQIKFTTANMESIYKAADYLNFEDLLDEAEKVMRSVDKTKTHVIVLLMNIARNHQLMTIESECKQSIILNPLSEVGKKHLIPALTFGHLKVLLKRINDRKEDMFHLCVEWVRSDQANRAKRLPELLQLIPLIQLSTEFLNETVFKNDLIQNDIECLRLLIEALKISKPKTSINCNSLNPQIETHLSKSPPSECLYAIGGKDENRNCLSSVSKLGSQTNKWAVSTPMPFPRDDFGCAVIGRKIYICGGYMHIQQRSMNELTVYDTDTGGWTQLRPMRYARCGCGMAVLDGFLYVAGGYYDGGSLSVVERYSVEKNEWETVTPMIIKRHGLELVSMNGFLYAIAGRDKIMCNSVERYSPQTNEWKAVASLHNDYVWFGSAVLNNRIYVAFRGNFEAYFPEYNEWYTMPAPIKVRGGERMAVFDGKLLLIGGFDGGLKDESGGKRVERFDFKTYSWVLETDMNVSRWLHSVAVVKNV